MSCKFGLGCLKHPPVEDADGGGILHPSEPTSTTRTDFYPDQKHDMCGYVLWRHDCGCYGALVCHSTCYRIFEEMNRINQPEAWQGDGLNELPFRLPDECVPGWHNTWIRRGVVVCDLFWHGGCLSLARLGVAQAQYSLGT